MKKIKTFCLCFLIVAIIGICFPTEATNAKAAQLRERLEKTYLFAVPEGGWSSITVHLTYVEKYSKPNLGTNKFYNRECWFLTKTAYATSKPTGQILTIKHYNSSNNVINNFTKWSHLDYVISTGYDSVWIKQNGKNMTYQNCTGNYAQISFIVSCNGGIPVGYVDGMRLNFRID